MIVKGIVKRTVKNQDIIEVQARGSMQARECCRGREEAQEAAGDSVELVGENDMIQGSRRGFRRARMMKME